MVPPVLVPTLVLALGFGVVDRDSLLRRSLDELHREHFEAALATAEELTRRHPDDAAGSLAAANVFQTMMRDYRVRAYEAEFKHHLQEALLTAERSVRTTPGAQSYFARGTARAYRAVHRFTTGDWVRGVIDAIQGVADAKRAFDTDPSFADPLLATALHDFWKGEKLGLGLGLFGGGGRTVVDRLERVRHEGRFLKVEAIYALQTVHLRRGALTRALDANDWLQATFPGSPVMLYHRGLILEGLGRNDEALKAWDALLLRLSAFPWRSEGFAAECQLHRALLLGRLNPGSSAETEARAAAARHAAARNDSLELEGPLVPFAEVRTAISRLPMSPRTAVDRR